MHGALRIFKALSDETRLRLMPVLVQHELSVNELVMLLGMGQSRVSRHLKILAESGLLTARRDGLWVFYSAADSGDGRNILTALMPFFPDDAATKADLDMARHIIEDRARKARHFFNAIAEDWDMLSREVLGGFDLPGRVVEAMPQPCTVAVDLGCGTGVVLKAMRSCAEQLIGVDGSSRMLELSRRRFGGDAANVSLRIGELDHLPLRDSESDFVCLNMVLHHLPDPSTALSEVKRIIRSGGRLVITDFDCHDHESMRTTYGDQWLGFGQEALATLLAEAGFSMQSCARYPVEQGLAVNMVVALRP